MIFLSVVLLYGAAKSCKNNVNSNQKWMGMIVFVAHVSVELFLVGASKP